MNDRGSFKKLQESDPLRSEIQRGEPVADLERLEAKARAIMEAQQATKADVMAGPTAELMADSVENVTDIRRGKRGNTWLVAASVAAALLLAGGGYVAGSRELFHGSDSAAGDTAAGHHADHEFAVTAQEAGAPERVAQQWQGNPAQADSSAQVAGPVEFRSSGLSDEMGAAPAYGFDPDASYSEHILQAVAQVVGARGELQYFGDSGAAGSAMQLGEYPDPVVYLENSATTTLSVNAIALNTPQDSAQASDTAAAQAQIQEVLAAAGVDAASWTWEFYPLGGGLVQVVGAEPELGARRVTAQVSESAIEHLTAQVAPVTELGEYPIISPNQAVRRLSDPRFADYGRPNQDLPPLVPVAAGGSTPLGEVPESDGPDTPVSSAAATAQPPAALRPGEPIAWPVTVYEITNAELQIRPFTLPDGTAALLPTYQLETAHQERFYILALADEALAY